MKVTEESAGILGPDGSEASAEEGDSGVASLDEGGGDVGGPLSFPVVVEDNRSAPRPSTCPQLRRLPAGRSRQQP